MAMQGQDIDNLLEKLEQKNLTDENRSELYKTIFGEAAPIAEEIQNVLVAQEFIENAIIERSQTRAQDETSKAPEIVSTDYLASLIEMGEDAQKGLVGIYRGASQKFSDLTGKTNEIVEQERNNGTEETAEARITKEPKIIKGFNKNVKAVFGEKLYGSIINNEELINGLVNEATLAGMGLVTGTTRTVTLASIKNASNKLKRVTENAGRTAQVLDDELGIDDGER